MFQTKAVEKIKRHFMFSILFFFFLENDGVCENMEKYCTARQATDDSIIQRMRVACWINKAINTHTEFELLLAFPLQLVTRTCLDVAFCVYCLSYRSCFCILA